MKLKKLASVMMSVLIFCGSIAVWMPALSASADINASAAEEQKTVVLDAGKGATAEDIRKTFYDNRYWYSSYGPQKTVKLKGTFKIDNTIDIYGGLIIDASEAVINSNADIVFLSYAMGDFELRGGKYNLGRDTRLLKVSNAENVNLDSVTINGGGSFDYGVVFMYNCIFSEIRNCKFNNTKSQAIYTYSGMNITVFGNTFNNTDGHAICVYGGTNDAQGNMTDIKMTGLGIIGNKVNGAKGDGIKCVRCSEPCNITGNTVKNIKMNDKLDYDELRGESRSGVGIMVMECDGANVGKPFKYNGKTYEGNSVTNTENYGTVVNLSDSVSIYKNDFKDIGTNGIHSSASSRTSIENCTLKNCGEIGIFFVPGPVESVEEDKKLSRYSKVASNKIMGCKSFGIDLAKASDVTVSSNSVYNCDDYAVYCIGSKKINIKNNTISETKTVNGSGIGFNAECSGINIFRNHQINLTLNKSAITLGKGEKFRLTSNLSVSWKTSASHIAKVDKNGNVTAVSSGKVYITAATSDGLEKACTITVKNAPSKITLTKGIVTIGVGEKFTLGSSVPNGSACSKRTYRTSNSSIVKMTRTDWQGDFVGVKPGVAYVTVRSYNGKESTCRVTVKKAPSSVTISKKAITLKVGQTATLSASIPSDAGCAARTFRTSNSSVVKMTKTNWTGSFKAMKKGTAYVTVRTYNGKESSCKVTVV